MAVFQNNLLAGAAAQSTTTPVHTIDQSIRFNDDDSPSLDKTYSGAGSRTTFTFSCWFKLGNTSVTFPFFNGGTGASDTGWTGVSYNSSKIYVQGFNTNWKITSRVLRDHAAWYHLVFVWDTTNTAASERIRIYINGQRETDFSTSSNPSASANAGIGQAQKHSIGYQSRAVGSGYADAYMAEIVYIDGTALDPSSFGEYNSSNIWIPKDVSSLTFGTNGFYIDGRDSSDLGDDESGNGNDYTTSGLAAHDQVSDSPTNSFAVLNPLDERGSGTLSEGNLQMAFGATNDNVTATQGLNTGKWYWEVYIVDKDDPYVGVQDSGVASTGYTEDAVALWVDGGYIYEDGSDTGDRSTTYANGDIVGVAFDVDNKKIWWSKNGQWYSADDSSTATINISEVEAGNQAQVITRSPDFFMPFVGNYNTGTVIMNFGQEGTFAGNITAGGNSDGNGVGNFKYSVPSGYLALCTKNLGS